MSKGYYSDSVAKLGRKSVLTGKPYAAFHAAMPLRPMVKAYADSVGLYMDEAVTLLLTEGLVKVGALGDVEAVEDGVEARIGLLEMLRGLKLSRRTPQEISAEQLVEGLLGRGCPPDRISISVEQHPNMARFCHAKGIRWVKKLGRAITFPVEYDN